MEWLYPFGFDAIDFLLLHLKKGTKAGELVSASASASASGSGSGSVSETAGDAVVVGDLERVEFAGRVLEQ